MLNTLGAIILAFQASLLTYAQNTPFPDKLIKEPAAIAYENNPVLVAIVDHYNNKGQWAGTFKIDRIVKFRIDKINAKQSIAHVKYYYVPLPNNPKSRTDSGIDQRTFTFIENSEGIKVIKMGAFNSTKL